MKISMLILSSLFMVLNTIGQSRSDTLVTKHYIDSLKRELAGLKERNNFLYWSYQEKISILSIDTVFIQPDSSVITYSFSDGKPLKRQFSVFDKNNVLVRYTVFFYDPKQEVKYIENWQTLKGSYFDSILSSSERFEYDSSGRVTLSVKYLQSVRQTIRRTFNYDHKGLVQAKTDILKRYALWED